MTAPGMPDALAGVVLAALVVYALLGGADYGGGVWDLLARGPRAEAQRALVARAIGPVWEANHVWLILVVVLLFVAFPTAFAAITTALHVPLLAMLVGIVLRGAAFAFRAYDPAPGRAAAGWARTFAIASLVVPVLLGVVVGALATGGGALLADGRPVHGFVGSWLGPFPFAVGALALALFAYLAAVYLTVEAPPGPLREDFRRRALGAQAAVAATALVALLLAREEAPRIHAGIAATRAAPLLHAVTAACAVAGVGGLWWRRWRLARAAAAGQAACIVAGWAAAQYPYLVPPSLAIADAAASRPVLRAVLIALGAGGILLLPSLGYLFWVFKRAHDGTSRAP